MKHDVLLIGVIAAVTFATRFLPFAVFGRGGRPPVAVRFLGRALPTAVMAILVVYCLRDLSFGAAAGFLPKLISVLVVAALHLWKRNTLLSIGAGTVCYMLLLRAMGGA